MRVRCILLIAVWVRYEERQLMDQNREQGSNQSKSLP
jgi:hypothetical protein